LDFSILLFLCSGITWQGFKERKNGLTFGSSPKPWKDVTGSSILCLNPKAFLGAIFLRPLNGGSKTSESGLCVADRRDRKFSMTGTGRAGCKHGVRNSKRSRLSRVREGRIGIGHWICEQRPLLKRTFGQVTLKIDRANGDLMIPAGTLLFTSGKASVGVVRPNGTFEIRTIAISQNWKSRESVGIGSDHRQSAAWPCGWRTSSTL
jgi:hypothetical protein